MAEPPAAMVTRTDAESVALGNTKATLSASAANASIVLWSKRPQAIKYVAFSDKSVFA
ncbi:MAG: hypothetical protein ACR2MG_09010 [Pyrinomonadaceae bacterium]